MLPEKAGLGRCCPRSERLPLAGSACKMGRQGMSDEANPYYKADYRWSAPCRNVAGMVEAEAHDPGVNNGDSSGPAPQLSKNQQKKQRRQEAARQKLLAKKAKEKAARKASQEKKLAEREQRIARMTEEERQAWDQRTQEKREVKPCSPSHSPQDCL